MTSKSRVFVGDSNGANRNCYCALGHLVPKGDSLRSGAACNLSGVNEILGIVSALSSTPLGNCPASDNPHVAVVVEGGAYRELEKLELVIGRRPLRSGLTTWSRPDKVGVHRC